MKNMYSDVSLQKTNPHPSFPLMKHKKIEKKKTDVAISFLQRFSSNLPYISSFLWSRIQYLNVFLSDFAVFVS